MAPGAVGAVGLESAAYDAARSGWYTQGVSLIDGVMRRGPQFVEAPEDATEEALAEALLALYGATP
jgi:hypothetical protein